MDPKQRQILFGLLVCDNTFFCQEWSVKCFCMYWPLEVASYRLMLLSSSHFLEENRSDELPVEPGWALILTSHLAALSSLENLIKVPVVTV